MPSSTVNLITSSSVSGETIYSAPASLVKALKSECGILSSPDLTQEYYSILRIAGYNADMSDFR